MKYFPGWFKHLPDTARSHVVRQELMSSRVGRLTASVETTSRPHDASSVVISKLGAAATHDSPFWYSDAFTRHGSVAYIPRYLGNLSAGPAGLSANLAYIYSAEDNAFLGAPIKGLRCAVDAVIDPSSTEELIALGIPSLFEPEYLHRTTKDKTQEIAQKANILAPKRYTGKSTEIDKIRQYFEDEHISEVVIKPNSGSSGAGVKIVKVDELADALQCYDPVKGYTVEERIVPDGLSINGLPHDWNVRLVLVEGEPIDWYVRASATPGPVNISLGAFLLTRDQLNEYIDPERLSIMNARLIWAAKMISEQFPHGSLGLDFMIRDGMPYLIEVNSGHMVCASFPDYPLDPTAMSPEHRDMFGKKLVEACRSSTRRYDYPNSSEIGLDPKPTYFDMLCAIEKISSDIKVSQVVAISDLSDLVEYIEAVDKSLFELDYVVTKLDALGKQLIKDSILDANDVLVHKISSLKAKYELSPGKKLINLGGNGNNPDELLRAALRCRGSAKAVRILLRAMHIQPYHENCGFELMSNMEYHLKRLSRDELLLDETEVFATLVTLYLGVQSVAELNLSEYNNASEDTVNNDQHLPLYTLALVDSELYYDFANVIITSLESSASPSSAPRAVFNRILATIYDLDEEMIQALKYWAKSDSFPTHADKLDIHMLESLGVQPEHYEQVTDILKSPHPTSWGQCLSLASSCEAEYQELTASLLFCAMGGRIEEIPIHIIKKLLAHPNARAAAYFNAALGESLDA